jgi:DMSO/TMAO reductase YedYZ molybdopterin-dependent catalytic subunit
MSARMAALAVLMLLAAPRAFAEEPYVAIGGQVQHPATLSIRDLEKLPATTVSVSFQTAKGPESATYTGALLWTVLANAGPIDAAVKNGKLRHTYLVTGSDGYVVALSEGELDPDFEGKNVVLAYEKDGKPMDAPEEIRLIVPADHHGGRAVHNVVRIDVQ